MKSKKIEKPILVPVDFSAHSEAALVFAAKYASRVKAPLKVLHVVHDPGEAPGYYSIKGRNKQLRRMEDVASDMLAKFVQKVKSGADHKLPALEHIEQLLVIGLPVNRILEVAKKADAQMIIMGSQGRTGLSRVLLGSKAEQVVHLSPLPVTIVKHPCKSK